MTRFGWFVVSGSVIALLGIALLIWGFARQSASVDDGVSAVERTPVVDPSTLAIYTNGTYGFSLFYPATATADDQLTDDTLFSWRASGTATGTPIVRIAMKTNEVRVGASADAKARAACETAGPSEEAQGSMIIGETSWKIFASEQLGTENERRVSSYRTLHGEYCFALETFEAIELTIVTLPPEDDVTTVIRNFSFAR